MPTPAELTAQLQDILSRIESANTILTRIGPGFADPPQPDHQQLLSRIKGAAANTNTIADGILRG